MDTWMRTVCTGKLNYNKKNVMEFLFNHFRILSYFRVHDNNLLWSDFCQ
jgi:hypothetical protein